MCIVLLNLSHPDFLFVCGANRDEALARPAAASHWHSFPPTTDFTIEHSPSPSLALKKKGTDASSVHPKGCAAVGIDQDEAGPSQTRPVLSGIDAHPSGGGTWIGITADGRFGTLTNFTEYERPPLPQGRGLTHYRSRGGLVKDWLTASRSSSLRDDLDGYLAGIDRRSDEWPGFNVLAGYLIDEQGNFAPRFGYVTNRENSGSSKEYLWPDDDIAITAVHGRGDVLHDRADQGASIGLSNSTFRTPWNKVKAGQGALDEALKRYDERKLRDGRDHAEAELAKDIFQILATPTGIIAKREDLRQTVLVTPLKMSDGMWYATRVATVIIVRKPSLSHITPNTQGTAKGQSEKEAHAQWWERDVCVLDAKGEQPVRCGPEHERHYRFAVSSQFRV